MKAKRLAVIGLGVVACAVPAVMALGGAHDRPDDATGLGREVRQATRAFHDVNAAMAAGYSSAGSCVSGPEVGAMGVHFPNGDLWATVPSKQIAPRFSSTNSGTDDSDCLASNTW